MWAWQKMSAACKRTTLFIFLDPPLIIIMVSLTKCRAGASGPAGPVLAGPIFCRKGGVSNTWPYVSAMVNCEQLL